jgi:uncharacterized protein YkwD
MFDAINARRQQAGLPSLGIQDVLTQAARTRSQDMANRDYFGHTTPEGTNFVNLLVAKGMRSGVVAEILGRTNGPDEQSVTLVMNAFMESPDHRPHVLGDKYASMGVGMAVGEGGMKYYAILFWGP